MGYKRILAVADDLVCRTFLEGDISQIDTLADKYITDNLDDAKAYITNNEDVELVILPWAFSTSLTDHSTEGNGEILLKFAKNCGIKTVVYMDPEDRAMIDSSKLSEAIVVDADPFDSLVKRILKYL